MGGDSAAQVARRERREGLLKGSGCCLPFFHLCAFLAAWHDSLCLISELSHMVPTAWSRSLQSPFPFIYSFHNYCNTIFACFFFLSVLYL